MTYNKYNFLFSDELLRREYPLEEFLWTGSGEGPDRDEGQISWVTTTVFKTTTKLVATPVSASFTMVTVAVCPGEQQPCLTPCKRRRKSLSNIIYYTRSQQAWRKDAIISCSLPPLMRTCFMQPARRLCQDGCVSEQKGHWLEFILLIIFPLV